jgi:hypothetical protein
VSDDRQAGDSADQSKGVFGNLPDSRPGARSPRRRSGSQRSEPTVRTKPPEQAGRPTKAPPASPPKARPQDAPHQDPEPPLPRSAGLEDLAWAGVAVAAEAATLGVKLASKAIESMRGTTKE